MLLSERSDGRKVGCVERSVMLQLLTIKGHFHNFHNKTYSRALPSSLLTCPTWTGFSFQSIVRVTEKNFKETKWVELKLRTRTQSFPTIMGECIVKAGVQGWHLLKKALPMHDSLVRKADLFNFKIVHFE